MTARAERSVRVAGLAVHVREGGSGAVTLLLHHSTGPHWGAFHELLARQSKLIAPDLPGYGASERPSFARSPRDLAILCNQLLHAEQLDDVNLVGLGLGGWIAAEMATTAQGRVRSLTLIGAAGIRPRSSFIHDPMMSGWIEYMRLGMADESAFARNFGEEPSAELVDLWDRSREMTARVTWKPWMWSAQLPHLLRGVSTPAVLIWGRNDRIVPPECAELYAEVLPHAEIHFIADAGHNVELEQPEVVARIIREFVDTPCRIG
jgi:pimeloyl-ACP methyl ester carboxylesterase